MRRYCTRPMSQKRPKLALATRPMPVKVKTQTVMSVRLQQRLRFHSMVTLSIGKRTVRRIARAYGLVATATSPGSDDDDEDDSDFLYPPDYITESVLRHALNLLSLIEDLLNGGNIGSAKKYAERTYFKLIRPYREDPIDTLEDVKREVEKIAFLGDIVLNKSLLGVDEANLETGLGRNYDCLKWMLRELNKEDEHYLMIKRYMKNTHGPTHDDFGLVLMNVWKLAPKDAKADADSLSYLNSIGNKKLLWHGSRATNFFGIFTSGLCIDPDAAPKCGSMFGKGIYFADMMSKAANYARKPPCEKTGLLVLAEVALGNVHDLMHSDWEMCRKKLPNGKHSVRGVGKYIKDLTSNEILDGDVEVPCGRVVGCGTNYAVDYNEFIVYDTRQIRLRYFVQVKFVEPGEEEDEEENDKEALSDNSEEESPIDDDEDERSYHSSDEDDDDYGRDDQAGSSQQHKIVVN